MRRPALPTPGMPHADVTRYICPNCRTHTDALAATCRSCGADFGEKADWRPIAADSTEAAELELRRLRSQPAPGKSVALRLLAGLGVAAVVLVGGGLLALVIDDYRTFGTERFNSAAWKRKPTSAEQGQCYRGGMAYDVKNNALRTGMSQAAVEELLGPPDTASGGYKLGLCSAWDMYSLELRYDLNGRLLSSHIVQH